jgi:hypothetical protein
LREKEKVGKVGKSARVAQQLIGGVLYVQKEEGTMGGEM